MVLPGMIYKSDEGEERTNVERIYNEAKANRIDLSKFNLD
jgi:hypothetical protein